MINHGEGKKGKISDIFAPVRLKTTLLLILIFSSALFAYQGIILLAVQLISMDTSCLSTGLVEKPDASCYLDCVAPGRDEFVNIVLVTLGDIPGRCIVTLIPHDVFL